MAQNTIQVGDVCDDGDDGGRRGGEEELELDRFVCVSGGESNDVYRDESACLSAWLFK